MTHVAQRLQRKRSKAGYIQRVEVAVVVKGTLKSNLGRNVDRCEPLLVLIVAAEVDWHAI